jgi:REP element-mobilizing transposase RayT
MSDQLAYFITFHCYGTWLQGDAPGSVDRHHNQPGDAFLPPDPEMKRAHQEKMDQPAYGLDAQRRDHVMRAIRDVCAYRGWRLMAAHIRASHVHVVVTTDVPPEKVMTDFKAYASRTLNAAAVDSPGRKRWSRHGSTRYLNDEASVAAAVDYVLRRQGEPMTVYDATTDEPRP